jgi:nucleoside-diphosphate-sugar epimerase
MFKLIEGNFLPTPRPNGTVSTIYSRNLVKGLLRCALSEEARGRTYLLADDGYHTWNEITGLMARALGKDPLRIRVPVPIIRLIGTISSIYSRFSGRATILSKEKLRMMTHPNLTVSNARAKRDFGYTTEVPIEAAIQETVDWYRENGWL